MHSLTLMSHKIPLLTSFWTKVLIFLYVFQTHSCMTSRFRGVGILGFCDDRFKALVMKSVKMRERVRDNIYRRSLTLYLCIQPCRVKSSYPMYRSGAPLQELLREKVSKFQASTFWKEKKQEHFFRWYGIYDTVKAA